MPLPSSSAATTIGALVSVYGPRSKIGIVLTNHPKRMSGMPLRVGVAGLGAGTLAAYGQTGDFFRFFEIDPDVISVAYGEGAVFSFIRDSSFILDSQARVDLTPGDARLSLEREIHASRSAKYDVLILDAFSGDAIPVHLLTREAFRIYFDALEPDGILAVHMSSRPLSRATSG